MEGNASMVFCTKYWERIFSHKSEYGSHMSQQIMSEFKINIVIRRATIGYTLH